MTPIKKRRMGVYIVDADNYQHNIAEIASSKKTVMVVCLCSSSEISSGVYNQVKERPKAQSKLFVYNVAPGKDNTDFFMAALTGWMIGRFDREYDYYIVSRDKIFIGLKRELENIGYNVNVIDHFGQEHE